MGDATERFETLPLDRIDDFQLHESLQTLSSESRFWQAQLRRILETRRLEGGDVLDGGILGGTACPRVRLPRAGAREVRLPTRGRRRLPQHPGGLQR